tara:strand:- start:225 stop:740 length:516 start_codon:yes stop_codon:yes gene_type:complete
LSFKALVPLNDETTEKNYITPEGMERLRTELHNLQYKERPKVVEVVSWAAGNGDRSENGDYIYGKKKLREIDGRIRHLRKRLEITKIVNPLEQTNNKQVFFGANVTYVSDAGKKQTVRIVGVDEARIEKNEISWKSPVALGLMRAFEGDVVMLRTPEGPVSLTIINVTYVF